MMAGLGNFETISEQEIVQKILAGETALFEILIRRNNPYLYKVGRSYGYNHHDTEDLMQDTFVNAFTSLSKFENRSSFRTWIIKIMLSNCFHKQRKFSYKNEIANDITDKPTHMVSNTLRTDGNKEVLNSELHNILENSLQQIPADYRMVFSLREVTGLSISETAEVLKISESNVKVRMNRARSMLRKELEKSYSASDLYDFNARYCDGMVQKVMEKIRALKQSPAIP